MPVSQTDRQVVESPFRAMQAGPQGEQAMMDLYLAGVSRPDAGARFVHPP